MASSQRVEVRTGLLRPGGLALVTLAAGLAFAADWDSPVRAVLVFGFLLFVPGLAIAELAAIREPLQQLAIAPAASLAAETLIALGLLYAGAYSTGSAFAIIAGLTVAATGVAALRIRASG